MMQARIAAVGLVLSALSACSSGNLSENRALELVKEREARFNGNEDDFLRTDVLYYGLPGRAQWLIDNGFAEGAPDNWQPINNVLIDPNPFYKAVGIPIYRKVLSIDGVTTEEKRATIRYRKTYTPIEPAYDLICIQNPQVVRGVGCSKSPDTVILHAVRQDDGKWQLGGGY